MLAVTVGKVGRLSTFHLITALFEDFCNEHYTSCSLYSGGQYGNEYIWSIGTLNPKISLLLEVKSLPVVWEAKMRCVKFWLKVLTSERYEGRLLRKIARQAMQCGKGVWVKNLAKCIGDFEWQGMGGDVMKSLTDAEIGDMLSSIAWRKVSSMWTK